MSESSGAIDGAIQKLLGIYQGLADEEKNIAPKRQVTQQKIDGLVDDLAAMGEFDESKVSAEMMAAFYVFNQQIQGRLMQGDSSAQMAMARFNQGFMEAAQAYFQKIQADPAKAQDIQRAVQSMSVETQPPKIEVGGIPAIEIAIHEPEGDYGEWAFAVVLISVDENFQAKVVDTLDYDLYVSMEITPHEGLSDEFNVPGKRIKAGVKFKPMSISYETVENGPEAILHVSGHIYKGKEHVQTLEFPEVPLAKQGSNDLDMDAIMKMMREGPGPNNRPN